MTSENKTSAQDGGGKPEFIRSKPDAFAQELEDATAVGRREFASMDPELASAIGFTHFDTGSSEDNRVTVLVSRDDLPRLASQMLLRIKSKEDRRSYLGVVVKGPFAEPDAVPPNSTMAVGVVVQGKKFQFTFDYHGRVEVEILGEELDGAVVPPRYRPRPKSPVFAIDEAESAKILGLAGENHDICLGVVVGYDKTEARIPSADKSVLPRHTGILGTTGGGKSTTVATTIDAAQNANIATIVFDVEGEYTHIDEKTSDKTMLRALERRGKAPRGVRDLHVLRLHGRDGMNVGHPNSRTFGLSFSTLSPYAIGEILEMSEPQVERFHRAYEVAKVLLKEFKIYPADAQEAKDALDVDEFTTGWPRMTIDHVLDVVSMYIFALSKEGKEATASRGRSKKKTEEDDGAEEEQEPFEEKVRLMTAFRNDPKRVLRKVMSQKSSHEVSWLALAQKLWQLRRLGIFDVSNVKPVDYSALLVPGRVTVIDLSDTGSPQLNNLVIADILRGVQEAQEERYQAAQKKEDGRVTPTLIIIEEAHEFLSSAKVKDMPVLFQQVARIAKRGRKRWLGLVFVTQLPQHLPNEVLGLLNNFIIHKITDSTVISRMQRTLGSIDESLWNRVSRLAPGQALVSFTSFTRPLMVAIDPAPCKRLLVD